MRRAKAWGATLGLALLVAGCGGGGGSGAAAGGESVCGGAVSSVPKACRLSVSPNPVRVGGFITITVGISDLEGDLTGLCLGLAPVGQEPAVACEGLTPAGVTVNEVIVTDPFDIGLPAGTYTMSLAVGDAAGHTSNAATTTFQVLP